MLKNKEIRHLIYLELIILLLGVILTISTNKYILKSYQEEIINNNAYIVNKLIEKYPSDEEVLHLEHYLYSAIKVQLQKINWQPAL